jgi:DNA-binding transcriptional LysR family regulator
MIKEIKGDFLQWLRGFYYVVKNQSVTQACFDMGRNQSTISYQIKSLENEFGITLFDRSMGKMELTSEGKMFLEKTISVFEIIHDMQSNLNCSTLENRGNISIAASHAIIQYLLMKSITQFRKKSPKVTFELEGGGLEMILDRVQSAEVDFGIATINFLPKGLVTHTLFETGMILITCKDNPFISGPEPTLEQIARVPYISTPLRSSSMDEIQRIFSKNDIHLNPVVTLNNYESIKRYVQAGIGVAILDSFTITKKDHKKLDVYPMDKFFSPRNHVIIMRKQKYVSPQARAFLESIKPNIGL